MLVEGACCEDERRHDDCDVRVVQKEPNCERCVDGPDRPGVIFGGGGKECGWHGGGDEGGVNVGRVNQNPCGEHGEDRACRDLRYTTHETSKSDANATPYGSYKTIESGHGGIIVEVTRGP